MLNTAFILDSPVPLSRFSVLDLTRVRSGPSAVRQLADWGADVIRVEAPVSVEPDDGLDGPRHAPDFQNLHRGKRSLTLNLKRPEGIAILRSLVGKADVLVENFRPDVKHRLGIDYESLRALNPRLVYASISGFGQEGPAALRPGFDQVAQGYGGLMSVTGLPGHGPVRVGIPIADLASGLYCAYGILAALLEREVSGQGQWVRTSLLEAQVALMDFQAVRWLIKGEVPGQAGNDHPTYAPMGVFPAADGLMNIAVLGQAMWLRFCHAIEAPELADEPDFATPDARLAHRARLNEAISLRTSRRKRAEWDAVLVEAGIPAGPINTMDQVFADPQVRHLGIAQEVDHPELGPLALVGQPVTLTRTPSALRAAAPGRGEHGDAILRSLGYSEAAIERLRQQGVI